MKRTWFIGICLLALIGVGLGCDSDSNSAPLTVEAAAGTVAQDLIVPALDALNRYNIDDVISGMPAAVTQGVGEPKCVDYSEACSTGTLEMCFEEFGQTYTFGDCDSTAAGVMLDGSLTEVGASATYNLTIDGVTMAGTVSLAYGKGCVTETLSGFTVTRSGSSALVGGELTYCEGEERPSGNSEFQTEGSSGAWSFDMTFDGTDSAIALVTNQSTQVSDTCTINLGTNTAICSQS